MQRGVLLFLNLFSWIGYYYCGEITVRMTIIEEIRNNPEEGAKRLERECKPGLLALARRLCVDSGDAEELVNRTIAEAVANIDSLLSQSALFGWMCQILVGCHQKDTRRKSHGEIIYPGIVPDVADEDAQEEIYRNLDHSLLREAIARLPEEDREILLLHYFLDIPIAKMAKVLAIPAGTVKSRLHYARKALAAKMGAKVAEAAKKPGIKAVLLALLLCGLTALGAGARLAVVRLLSSPSAAVEQQADNSKDAGHATSDMQQAEACAATQSATDCYRPPATENSNFSTDNSPGETMNISKKFTRAAMLAAATVATSAAIPAMGDTITYDGTAQTINADTHYEVLVVSAATTVTVAQGATLTVDEFIGNAALTKEGAGTLAVKNFSANSKITASAGTVRFAAGGPTDTTVFDDANTFFHVDASASASMTTAGTQDGNTLVSQLADIRGAGHPTASPVGGTGTQFNKPWIDAGALNGLDVLDFGSYYRSGTAEDGYGAALCWSEASSAIQEVLIVQADAHDCRIQFLLGCMWPENNSGRTYDYHRGSSGALFNGTHSSPNIRNGSIYMDGLSATAATVPSEGFHVFRLVQSGATKASAFADDRETLCRGGVRLAEAIVLTANLDAVSSRRLEMRLQQKWLPGNRPIANLSISSGATLTVDEGVKIIAKGGTLNPSAIVTGAGEAQYEVSAYQYSHPAKSVAKIGSAAVNLRASAARRVRVDEGTLSIVTAAAKLTPALHLDPTHTGQSH